MQKTILISGTYPILDEKLNDLLGRSYDIAALEQPFPVNARKFAGLRRGRLCAILRRAGGCGGCAALYRGARGGGLGDVGRAALRPAD